MSRQTYVWCPVKRAVVEKGYEAAPVARGPMVISDIPETVHPCDGRTYSSRRQYEAVTRAHGGIEIGRREMARLVERGPQTDHRRPVRESIREALQRLG